MACPDQKAANRRVSRVIPVFLLGAITYASYVVTKPLCIDYLFHSSSNNNEEPRLGVAIAVIVLFYLLAFAVVITYTRLYFIVLFSPDYLPRGAQLNPGQSQATEIQASTTPRKKRSGRRRRSREFKHDTSSYDLEDGGDQTFPISMSGLESFHMKDVFVCQQDGRPPFCSKCSQFKTDRSHHCREVDRCVQKMDHFCPWVGGVVSESSFKFFIQFNFYTAIFCTFNLIVFAVFTAERRQKIGDVSDQWLVALGLASFFLLFSTVMFVTSIHLALINSSTIENISRKTKVWTLAIRIRNQELDISTSSGSFPTPATFQTITFPSQLAANTAPTRNESGVICPEDSQVFAILQTKPGENPFDLGTAFKNLQQVMGYTAIDWLLPLKVSPCVDHKGTESTYPMGPVVERLKREAGLA